MSNGPSKSSAQPKAFNNLSELHWRSLHAGLAFLAAANLYTTPVYSAMASAAAGATIVLMVTVAKAFVVLVAPFSIVAVVLVAGTLMKWCVKSKIKRARIAQSKVRGTARRKSRKNE
jgi:membrane protein implicated in regulation of membrane protease activity